MSHKPPTGKHCRQARIDEATEEGNSNMLPLLTTLQTQMAEMAEELRQLRAEKHSKTAAEASPENTDSSEGEDINDDTANGEDSEQASPETLRKDRRLMRRAAERLAQLGTEDSDDETPQGLGRDKKHGKKSGSVMTTTDKVLKTIDWPHFYINRVVDGKRKNIAYADLRIEEFVFGFHSMLDNPRSKFDYTIMKDLLKDIMQDAMDFSWGNARAFYQLVGVDVESGILSWDDERRISKMRFTYSRAALPQRRELKDNTRPPLTPASANMRCCMPYQTRECSQTGDHAPFTHACAYCARARTALCRHPEDECMRKANDSSKNVKPRE